MTREPERIADQILRSYRGDAWHGPSLAELLTDVEATAAEAHPIESVHSIWEIILHLTTWISLASDAIEGKPIPAWPFDGDWPTPENEWDADTGRLQDEIARLCRLTAKLDDEQLTETVPGREYSFYYLLHGSAQHNLYHAGQIALIKKTFANSLDQ